MQFRRANKLPILLFAALIGLGAGGAAQSDVLDGLLEVKSAYVSEVQGVFQLYARVPTPSMTTFARRSRTA